MANMDITIMLTHTIFTQISFARWTFQCVHLSTNFVWIGIIIFLVNLRALCSLQMEAMSCQQPTYGILMLPGTFSKAMAVGTWDKVWQR